MIVDTNTMISDTRVSQNLSKTEEPTDESVRTVSERLIRQNMEAYRELAK